MSGPLGAVATARNSSARSATSRNVKNLMSGMRTPIAASAARNSLSEKDRSTVNLTPLLRSGRDWHATSRRNLALISGHFVSFIPMPVHVRPTAAIRFLATDLFLTECQSIHPRS